MIYRHFIIACFVFSFFFSLLLLVGEIEDFFLFYHAGSVMANGGELYRDLADDKGPVAYIFFFFLYQLFGTHSSWALLAASTVLDALLCILLFFWLRSRIPVSLPKKPLWQYALAFVLIAYLKSFSIGTVAAGVYTEQLAMVLLMVSFMLLDKKRLVLSGILFSLAVCTRQSVIFYLLVPIFLLLQQKRRMAFFLSGTLSVFLLFVVYWWGNGLLYSAWEMMIWSVGVYRTETSPLRFSNIATTLFVQTRILFSLLFVGMFFIHAFGLLGKQKNRLLVFGLFIASMVSVFAGAEVWGHHFLQWMPLFFFSFFWIYTYRPTDIVFRLLGVMILLSVGVSYIGYNMIGTVPGRALTNAWSMPAEVAQKKYLLVVPFYTRLYVEYQKESPDRYVQIDFWMSHRRYGSWADQVIADHAQLSAERLRDTAFVFLSTDGTTSQYQWYLDTFGEPFRLVKKASYHMYATRMDIYVSQI